MYLNFFVYVDVFYQNCPRIIKYSVNTQFYRLSSCIPTLRYNYMYDKCFEKKTPLTATHFWIWGSNMAAFPVMVPDFFVL